MAWLKATSLYSQNRYREAIPHYLQGLKYNAQHPAAKTIRLDLAYSLFKLRQIPEAIYQLQQIRLAEPYCLETILKIAHLQSWLGRDSEVVSIISKALPHIVPSREILSLLAIAAMRSSGDPEFVRNTLIKAKQPVLANDKRGDHLLKIALAKYAFISGDRHIGRRYLLELTETEAASPEALLTLSEILIDQGKIVFARQQLRRALELVPQHPIVLALLSETYLVEGAGYNPSFALQLSISAVQASSWNSPDALYSLAKSYFLNKESDAALMVLDKADKENYLGSNLSRVTDSLHLLREQLKEHMPVVGS